MRHRGGGSSRGRPGGGCNHWAVAHTGLPLCMGWAAGQGCRARLLALQRRMLPLQVIKPHLQLVQLAQGLLVMLHRHHCAWRCPLLCCPQLRLHPLQCRLALL